MFPQASLSVLDSTLKHMSTLEGAMEHLLSNSGQSGKGSFAFIFSITLLTDQGNIRIIVHIFTTDEFIRESLTFPSLKILGKVEDFSD